MNFRYRGNFHHYVRFLLFPSSVLRSKLGGGERLVFSTPLLLRLPKVQTSEAWEPAVTDARIYWARNNEACQESKNTSRVILRCVIPVVFYKYVEGSTMLYCTSICGGK
jgi:hypothetical protein